MEYLDCNDPEWDSMWQQVGLNCLNDGDQLCINNGLSWEYMGSTADHHHLRHPSHPTSGKTEYIYIERIRMAQGWT